MNPELGGFDIISPEMSRDWLVIGWFTPDYRGLAERFAGNLNRFAIPHHLFAKPIGSGWDTSRKPSVILEAMDLYPGKTIILMDVDCIVDGDIRPVLNFQQQIHGAPRPVKPQLCNLARALRAGTNDDNACFVRTMSLSVTLAYSHPETAARLKQGC